jgi:hypothetical protein
MLISTVAGMGEESAGPDSDVGEEEENNKDSETFETETEEEEAFEEGVSGAHIARVGEDGRVDDVETNVTLDEEEHMHESTSDADVAVVGALSVLCVFSDAL